MRVWTLPPLLLTALACGAACGAASDDGDAAVGCVPGEQRACPCTGGGPDGVQVCADNGDRFGFCVGCLGDATTAPAPTTTAEPTATTTDTSDSGEASSSGPAPGEPSDPPQAVPPMPPPDGAAIVEQVAAEHPDWLQNSCLDSGGTNDFIYEVVRRLRQQDDRWGLNWKRGVVGDMSQDVVDYHYGDGVSEGSTDVYILDVIVGHCGPTPSAGWIDVTQDTLDADTIGVWTLAGQDL
mgnify:CR=1 FL=1